MSLDVLLGLQWGDEGKGKIVDVLAPRYDVVARFQGGPNAGHTLEFDGIKHVLHQIASRIFREDIKNIVGNGVVLDPIIFKQEVEKLSKFNLDYRKNLFLSSKTQIILPTHRLLDAAYEKSKGEDKIGSTLKGIGPAYQDKIGRNGLRVGDILEDNFKECYQQRVEAHKKILSYYKFDYSLEDLENEFFTAVEFLKTLQIVNSEYLINKELKSNKKVLAEGAQGSMLDIDFGSYPFVTSSNTTSAGVCSGLGVAPNQVNNVIGIFKAYCTRVGGGPFPTELFDDDGKKLQDEGHEFGATTGRPRRCGWLDLPALKYTIMLNGVTELYMMKADVLNSFKTIKVCTHYKLADGTITDELPYNMVDQVLTPVYKEFKGWDTDTDGFSDFGEFPTELLDYIQYIETELETPINLVSLGPDRTQTVMKGNAIA